MIQDSQENIQHEKEILQTRAMEYEKKLSDKPASTTSAKRSACHNPLKCIDHENRQKDVWLPENTQCNLCVKFSTATTTLKSNILPRNEGVLNLLLSMKAKSTGKNSNSEYKVAVIVYNQWIFCNVYPASLQTVECKVWDMFEEYDAVKKFSTISDAYWKNCTPFLQKLSKLFDVVASKDRRKTCEQV